MPNIVRVGSKRPERRGLLTPDANNSVKLSSHVVFLAVDKLSLVMVNASGKSSLRLSSILYSILQRDLLLNNLLPYNC